MPTATQYDLAASRFRAQVRRWRDELGASPTAMLDFAHGPVRDELDARLVVALGGLAAGADQLAPVAVLCDQRAEVCRQYARDVFDHLASPQVDRWRSGWPQPPFPWVER